MGCSSPLTDSEKKSLQAAAIAQQRTGGYNTIAALAIFISNTMS
jgi:predicted metal-dependent phosphotriesterase family hydrolase